MGYVAGVDLTATTGAATAVSGSPLAAFADAAGGWHWAYFTANQHLNGIQWTAGGGYANAGDITAASSAPAGVAGSALAAFGDSSGGQHWAYFGTNQHVYNLASATSGGYSSADVTANATNATANGGAPAAVPGSGLAAFADSNGTQYWAYLASNGHAYNLSYSTTSGGGYVFADLTTGSGAPAAAGTLVTGFSVHGGGQEEWAYLGANNNVYQISGASGPYTYSALSGTATAGINLTARTGGLSTDYSLTSATAFDANDFTAASFNTANSGSALTGGANAVYQTVYDTGTITLTVNGFTVSMPYQQGTTAAGLATAITGLLNNPSSSVMASASGPTVMLTALEVGTAGDYPLAWTASTSKPSLFSQPSFGVMLSGSTLGGGMNPTPPSLASSPMVTLYNYDVLGNLLCVEQHGNVSGTGCSAAPSNDATSPWRVRRFSYDSLSRLLTATNPESGQISYSYDADGNVVQKTSPAPNQPQGSGVTQTISYCYDVLNRIVGKGYGAQGCPLNSPAVQYFYDAGTNGIGHLTSWNDQAGSGSYSYDGLGRIATEQRTINPGPNLAAVTKNLSYAYNLDSSIATLTYPSGAVITYTPDSAGRMLSAVDQANSINYVTGATYDPASSVIGFVSGNTITNSVSYNNRLQPTSMSATSGVQTLFGLEYNFHWGAGDNGNVWSIANTRDTSRNQTFSYDALNRLISAQNAGADCSQNTLNGKTRYWGNSYGFDAWGNLINKTPTKCSAESLNAAALANNQLSGYGYDSAGNMIHDATTGNTYSYDQENRITGAAGFTYTYDDDGNRVEKSNGTTGTLYWYMTPGIVAESDLSGNLQSQYVFFDGERVARKDFPSGAVSYYFSDELKTASVITDSAGNIKEDEDYYPWGGELQFINNDSNHYKFGGHERDNETGLDYMLARYYSSPLGRFLTPDWAGKPITVPYANFGNPQSLNLYSYTQNNPTTLGDPDGHQCSPNCFPGGAPDFQKSGKDMLIGAAKGLGTDAYNTGKAVLAGAANGTHLYGLSPQSQAILGAPLPGALQPSNPIQAGASQATQVVFTVATVVNVVGAAATVEVESIPATQIPTLANDALVVRGGIPTAAQLTKGAESIAADGTLQGVSVQSGNGATVEQLSQGIPNNKIGVSTVGDMRGAGGDVVPTPQPGNPCHCDLNGVTAEKGSKLFKVQENPSKVKTPKSTGGDN